MGRIGRRVGTALGVIGLVLAAFSPATAAPKGKPGPVTGLSLSMAHPADHYLVTAHWDAYPNATKYVVKMVDSSGMTIPQGTTAATYWTHDSFAAAGTAVTVTVTVYVGKMRGKSAQVSALLPDITAPVGAYSLIREAGNPTSGNVTIQQDALSDNVDPLADLTQTVDWDDGTPAESWSPLDLQITHIYPGAQHVYYPTVTVADLAGNTATYQLVVSVADTQAPTGTFSAGPPAGYAGWTTISVVQAALSDDLSSPAHITRVVDWGDGSAPDAWTSGATLDHVYAVAGTYTPTVTVTDQAGNSAVIDSSEVTVSTDTSAPTLRIAKPHRLTSVRAWRHLHGLDADTGVGVAFAKLKVVQKRHGAWFSYTFRGHTWTKVGASKRAALRKGVTKVLTLNDLNHWSVKARGLRKGYLVVRVVSADNVGNVARHTAKHRLTTR